MEGTTTSMVTGALAGEGQPCRDKGNRCTDMNDNDLGGDGPLGTRSAVRAGISVENGGQRKSTPTAIAPRTPLACVCGSGCRTGAVPARRCGCGLSGTGTRHGAVLVAAPGGGRADAGVGGGGGAASVTAAPRLLTSWDGSAGVLAVFSLEGGADSVRTRYAKVSGAGFMDCSAVSVSRLTLLLHSDHTHPRRS